MIREREETYKASPVNAPGHLPGESSQAAQEGAPKEPGGLRIRGDEAESVGRPRWGECAGQSGEGVQRGPLRAAEAPLQYLAGLSSD